MLRKLKHFGRPTKLRADFSLSKQREIARKKGHVRGLNTSQYKILTITNKHNLHLRQRSKNAHKISILGARSIFKNKQDNIFHSWRPEFHEY